MRSEEDRDMMLQFAAELVRDAAEILKGYLGQAMVVRSKSSEVDLVTEADLASERFIIGAIRKQYPGHGVLSEEEAQPETDSDYLWLIDPLDGTVNFAHGFPVFSVTVAVHHQLDFIIGVTYDPLRDELFTASRGHGAALNGRRIRVSTARRLVQALVATGFPYKKATIADNNLAEFNRMVPRIQGVRRGGSAALDLAYVAAGRLDGYWESHLSPWDWAAGFMLVEEAGGKVTDRNGHAWTLDSVGMVASNGAIHEDLLNTLNGS